MKGGKLRNIKMKEIQIRGINQRQANKIIDILFNFCFGSSEPKAYKNEFKEDVTEFWFESFNEENIKKLIEVLK